MPLTCRDDHAMIRRVIHRNRGRLLHGVLTTFTAGLLSLHIALGCCWHHGHSCDSPGSCATLAKSAASSCCGHHHPVAHTNNSQSSGTGEQTPSHQHSCDGSKCQFVKSETSQQAVVVNAFFCQAFATVLVLDTGVREPSTGTLTPLSPAATLPIRLHLLHGLLLI